MQIFVRFLWEWVYELSVCLCRITGKIPVKFIYGRAKVDLSTLSTLVAKEKWNEKVFLAADVRYEHCLGRIVTPDILINNGGDGGE